MKIKNFIALFEGLDPDAEIAFGETLTTIWPDWHGEFKKISISDKYLFQYLNNGYLMHLNAVLSDLPLEGLTDAFIEALDKAETDADKVKLLVESQTRYKLRVRPGDVWVTLLT